MRTLLLSILVLLSFLSGQVKTAAYTYSTCNSSSSRNPANLACTSCPSNQVSNNYQTVPMSCQCSAGYSLPSNPNANACTASFTTTCATSNSYYPVYDLTGAATSGDCVACGGSAYSNSNGSACTYCGPGMTYSSTQGCICSNTAQVLTQLGCFQSSVSPSVTTSTYATQLRYLIPACSTFNDPLSCSMIINLCTYSQHSATAPQCIFFTTYTLTSILYADATAFSLTPTSTPLNLKLVTFAATGNYIGQKSLLLGDLLRCGTPSDSEVGLTFGTNIQMSCSYNFNHLISQMSGKQYKSKLYQLLVQDDSGSYFDVPVYLSGSTQGTRRFFLEDTYSYPSKINVLTSLTLEFTFSNGKLISPALTPLYTLLTTELGTGVVGSPEQTISYNIRFNSDMGSFFTGALISFIVMVIVALVHAIGKTYISYLNRKSALAFFVNFIGVFSLWLFYYLLIISGYWFLFTKTTSSPFLLLPPTHGVLYPAFYALVGVMVLFRLLYSLSQKSDKLSTEVYLINWQRGQFRNSWRQIFIVNSLAQFYTYRTVSLFWMLAFVLVFSTAIGWQDLAAETTSASSTYYPTLTPSNRILLYFLAAAIFLAVGFVFKVLRRLSVLFWPYPFQDFVDYCTVTNISFVFIKRRAPHAYYLHAALPDRTDVTYRQINDAIRRGLQKNRSVGNEISSVDELKLYTLYLSKDIEERHTMMLKKLEEQQHAKRMKYIKESGKKKLNLREDFVQNRLKPHIEGMVNRQNDQRKKSFFQSYCGTPPIDLRQDGGRSHTLVYFDDSLDLVSDVFPNGNQFEEIHTLIVIFLGWTTLFNSFTIAAFLTYLVDQVIEWWVGSSCRKNLQEMTKVKRGFMI